MKVLTLVFVFLSFQAWGEGRIECIPQRTMNAQWTVTIDQTSGGTKISTTYRQNVGTDIEPIVQTHFVEEKSIADGKQLANTDFEMNIFSGKEPARNPFNQGTSAFSAQVVSAVFAPGETIQNMPFACRSTVL